MTYLRKTLLTAFTVQRGFAALDMSSDEMKCSDIVYNSSDFYSLQPIHVLLTVNHGGQTNGLVHDVRMRSVSNRLKEVRSGSNVELHMRRTKLSEFAMNLIMKARLSAKLFT